MDIVDGKPREWNNFQSDSSKPEMSKLTITTNERSYEFELLDEPERIRVNGVEYLVDFLKVSGKLYSLILEGRTYELQLQREGEWTTVSGNGFEHRLLVKDERWNILTKLGQAKGVKESSLEIKAPMPGLVTRVHVRKGDSVSEGQGLIVLEAMKMENEIRAPLLGVVKDVLVAEGIPVERGDLLVRLTT